MPVIEGPAHWKGQPAGRLQGGEEPPYDGRMEHRVTALETRLDTILPTLSTKGDVDAVRADISRWMLATLLTIIGTMLAAIFGVAQVIKGQQSPAAPTQQTPIIINNIPPQQQIAPSLPAPEKGR